MNKFSLLLSLSFFMASVADLQAYRGQEIVNKGLEKGKELFAFVKSSRKAQIVTLVTILVVSAALIAQKSKSKNSASGSSADDNKPNGSGAPTRSAGNDLDGVVDVDDELANEKADLDDALGKRHLTVDEAERYIELEDELDNDDE